MASERSSLEPVVFWAVLGGLVVATAMLIWFDRWVVAIPLALAGFAYLLGPRLEANLEGEGATGASRRAWATLRGELALIALCLLAVFLWVVL